jgi:DNA-binding winged helix-turn-helix (wHTH) protein
MTIKTPAVLEDAVHRIPIAELTSGVPLSQWINPSSNTKFSERHEDISQFEPDNFRIALVSFHNRADGNLQQADRINRLFLLPLTWRQFVIRVREALRHATLLEQNKIVRFGRVSMDLLSMEVRRSERLVSLTAMEFKVLKFFVSNPNRVISRNQLLNEVWGYDDYPCTRTVDNHVLKLRQKLEPEPADPVHFRTVHGIGYKFIP